jgi:hypothetical protein
MMRAMSATDKPLAEALRERAAELQEEPPPGGTRVVSVTVRSGEDSEGSPALFVELVLSAPPEDQGTWPVDDLWLLRRMLSDAVRDIPTDVSWFVTFEPETAEEVTAEDAGDVVSA